MNPTLRALPSALFLGLLAPSLIAQGHELHESAEQNEVPQLRPAASSAIDATTGLQQKDGYWIGGGADYEVLFEDERVRFVPVLPAAPSTAELVWTTSGIARGQGATYGLPAAQPVGFDEAGAQRIEYRRGPVTETYDLRLDGLKQSFVFKSLPAGEGDLVVRGRIDSALPFTGQDDQGLRFSSPEIGAVTIGKVTGFDANGESIEGSIVFDGQNSEFRLPGHWVEHAALPIVVDPLIGGEIALGTSATYEEEDPAIAYDASEDVYLVVWKRKISGSQHRIRGQRLNGDGSPLGPTLFISSGGTYLEQKPDVANVFSADAFAVVFSRELNVYLYGVGTDGTISNEVTISASPNFEFNPAVGGETSADNDVTVVWDDSTLGIRARSVQFPQAGDPVLLGLVSVTGASDQPGYPSISKSGGSTGNHLIVWNDQGGNGTKTRVLGRVFDRNLNPLTPARVLQDARDADYPQCDGNGTNWIVAYESETNEGSGDNDVMARSVFLSAEGTLKLSSIETQVAFGQPDDERGVDVAWLGSTALISYSDEKGVGTGNYDVHVQAIDSLSARRIGDQVLLALGAEEQDFVHICSRFSGDPNDTSELALIAWSESSPGESAVRAHLWGNNVDGALTRLGGGCGPTGTVNVGSATVGNASFQIALTDAPTLELAVLVVSPTVLNASCGLCTLVPNPATGATWSLPTFSDGDVRVSLPIPNSSSLRGARFLAQWVVTNRHNATCAQFGLDLSDAVGVEIE